MGDFDTVFYFQTGFLFVVVSTSLYWYPLLLSPDILNHRQVLYLIYIVFLQQLIQKVTQLYRST